MDFTNSVFLDMSCSTIEIIVRLISFMKLMYVLWYLLYSMVLQGAIEKSMENYHDISNIYL